MYKCLVYKKRSGTTGISGHLYETKLLSLILHRAIHDEDIEEFYLGTNVDGLGVFDDICFRVKLKHFDRPLVVFIQVKHREDKNKKFDVTADNIAQFYDSYLKIIDNFHVNSTNILFRGKISDIDCVVVFYTTINGNITQSNLEGPFIEKLNSLICTGVEKPLLYDQYFPLLHEIIVKGPIKQLADVIAAYIHSNKKNADMFMMQEIIQRYHVVLAREVFHVNELQHKFRTGTFRTEFLETEDAYLVILKEYIFMELLLKRYKDQNRVDLSQLLSDPSAQTLSEYLGKVVTYDERNGKLIFVSSDKYLPEEREKLQNLNVAESTVRDALQIAGLGLVKDKVIEFPAAFGNLDLNLNKDKVENRLDYLKTKIIDWLEKNVSDEQSEDILIVDLDNNIKEQGTLAMKGGLASGVGNLLVLDEKTKLLKFGDFKNLPNHAKTLLEKISKARESRNNSRKGNKIPTLDKFRFRVKVKNFPKISLEFEDDMNSAKDFLKRLLFYTNQANQETVELKLKDILKCGQTNSKAKADIIFALFHEKIQKWWMEHGQSSYLTKDCDWFQEVLETVKDKPYVFIMNVLNKMKTKNIGLKLDENVVRSLDLDKPNTQVAFLTTDSVRLSLAKVTNACEDYSVIDLDYLTSISSEEYENINLELSNENKEKMFILVCESKSEPNVRIKHTIKILESGKVVVITYKEIAANMKNYFTHVDIEVHDENNNLLSLPTEHQQSILENNKVTFQGIDLNLNSFLDDVSKEYISGELLRKLMQYENITIGITLTESRYEEIKKFYISRSVKKKDQLVAPNSEIEGHATPIKVNNVYDVDNICVAIIAPLGSGKSCLLSHVALNTKAHYPTLWIVRLNLFDYSKHFREWRENVTEIDILEALGFICKTLVTEKDGHCGIVGLQLINNEIHLNDGVGVKPSTLFELRMFLHFYNKSRVVFLFDGYDEIRARYEKQVNQFLKAFKPHKQPFWITSRRLLPPNLELEFEHYELNDMPRMDQRIFLERFLNEHLDLNDHKQRKKIDGFFSFIKSRNFDEEIAVASRKFRSLLLNEIYADIAIYFQKHLWRIYDRDVDKDRYLKAWKVDFPAMNEGILPHVVNTKILNPTPLQILMVVDCFQNDIKKTNDHTEWAYIMSILSLYDRFIKIKSQDDQNSNVNRFLETHKKLAAYSFFYQHANEVFNDDEIDEIKVEMKAIISGGGALGLIIGIIEHVPRFVHSSMADYLAMEYICEELTRPEKKISVDFILNIIFCLNDSLPIFDDKLVLDEKLKNLLIKTDVRASIFDVLTLSSKRKSSISEFDAPNSPMSLETNALFTKAVLNNLDNLVLLFREIWEENDVGNSQAFKKLVRVFMTVKKAQKRFKQPLSSHNIHTMIKEWLAASQQILGYKMIRAHVVAMILILFLLIMLFL